MDFYVTTRVTEVAGVQAGRRRQPGDGADRGGGGDPGGTRSRCRPSTGPSDLVPHGDPARDSSGCAARAGPPRTGGRGRGDIRYWLAIDVPRDLSREQKQAVDEFDKASTAPIPMKS